MQSFSTVLSIAALLCVVIQVALPRWRQPRAHTYTWKGHDFPENIPGTDVLPLVKLTVEETLHYPLSNDTDEQWASLVPVGFAYVRLGSHSRLFAVSMYHQLHCLRRINRAFGPGDDAEHIRHCLSYLRHTTLCGADLTLEPGDFAERDFARERVGQKHVCRDWSAVHDMMDANWDHWRKEKAKFPSAQ
ncbi:hypothetical protein EXIGLDRAFT_820978 [Exidia glandulosa HHB12029]|uniref:Oxidase ustYa n=1 Tax=Exidia glandulosa HHB12029 TaxID=1314781 RepID=A0A166AUC6_EXIGL|nr:hypothetical protein EXIGLDRAFT_820978 [Exidia glandulosa HHB12029]